MDGKTQAMTITRAIIHTALYWPIWWTNEWIINHLSYGIWAVLGKLFFYVNLFYMLINWCLIAKRIPEVDRDIVIFSLFIILILVLMELPTWIYVLTKGPG